VTVGIDVEARHASATFLTEARAFGRQRRGLQPNELQEHCPCVSPERGASVKWPGCVARAETHREHSGRDGCCNTMSTHQDLHSWCHALGVRARRGTLRSERTPEAAWPLTLSRRLDVAAAPLQVGDRLCAWGRPRREPHPRACAPGSMPAAFRLQDGRAGERLGCCDPRLGRVVDLLRLDAGPYVRRPLFIFGSLNLPSPGRRGPALWSPASPR
jgi:hypothetical protein